jgi:hypothetical protein
LTITALIQEKAAQAGALKMDIVWVEFATVLLDFMALIVLRLSAHLAFTIIL